MFIWWVNSSSMNEWDVPANIAEMVARIGIAFVLGLVVGFERQWRARMAGLRTNVLVSVGAALFVLFGAYAFTDRADADPTRVAAQVVSGIGFLGAGVIWRQSGSISGLNTAATLWATAAVGVLAGGGLYVAAAVGTVTIVVANTLLRPLARTLDRQPTSGGETSAVPVDYTLGVRCRESDEAHVREIAIQTAAGLNLTIQSVSSEKLSTAAAIGPTTILVTVVIRTGERSDTLIEEAVRTLMLEPGVSDAQWIAHGRNNSTNN